MFFNHFRIERLGEHSVLYFGLVSDTGLLLDNFVCLASARTLEKSRTSLLEYLKRLEGEDTPEQRIWLTQFPPKEVQAIDIIVMTHGLQGDAEISFSRFAAGPAVQAAKTEKKTVQITSDPIIVLRCSIGMQKLLILSLYGGTN